MKKPTSLRDHVFRPVVYTAGMILFLIASFFGGKKLLAEMEAPDYADVPDDHWAAEYIDSAAPCMTGSEKDGNILFRPSEPLNRAEMAKIIHCIRGE